jgi:hypothetical protein
VRGPKNRLQHLDSSIVIDQDLFLLPVLHQTESVAVMIWWKSNYQDIRYRLYKSGMLTDISDPCFVAGWALSCFFIVN